jgi:hypothetical protein
VSTQTKGRKCTGKRRYSTLQKALKAVTRLVAKGAHPDRLNAYPCEHCDGHHIGHTSRDTGRRKRS